MTIGASIQKYRKNLGLSQEELGQKLLVSRQTISLWEKDQTTPTIDNLMRLKEIFGVTVDEIFGFENEKQDTAIQPDEVYCFHYTKEELNEIGRLQRKSLYKKPMILILIGVFLILFLIGTSAPDILIGLAFGMLFMSIVSHVKGVCAYNKAWKNSMERICASTYEYQMFQDYIGVNIYRKNEKIRESKCDYTDIEQIQQLGKWLFLRFGGQTYIIRKSDLKENSAFYLYMVKHPSKTIASSVPNKWRMGSILFFVASLFSILGALILESAVSSVNRLFVENMWVCFLLTPIPISSIVFGFVLKSKGYKYKKNIIVGIIMTALLCIYGSFAFLFADAYDHSNEPIVRVEQTIGIDIPEHRQITTQDWTKGTQSVPRGYIYSTSDVYFDNAVAEAFEKQLVTDEKWLSSISNDLIGITSPMNDSGFYDYVLIYNTDTSAYNALPSDSGKFRFISLLYQLEDNRMKIVEYDIDYVKSSDS